MNKRSTNTDTPELNAKRCAAEVEMYVQLKAEVGASG